MMLECLAISSTSYSYITFKAKKNFPFDERRVIILITRLLRLAYIPSNSANARGINSKENK
jgi:hypothetical protein